MLDCSRFHPFSRIVVIIQASVLLTETTALLAHQPPPLGLRRCPVPRRRRRLDGRANQPLAVRHGVSDAGTTHDSTLYIVASAGWVPPVTVSSPSRTGSLQTVSGWNSAL